MNELNFMLLFKFEVDANDTQDGMRKTKPMVAKCEKFADAFNISVNLDHFSAFDGTLPVRVVFQIHDKQQPVLSKVSALFAFAASAKLTFVNWDNLSTKQEF